MKNKLTLLDGGMGREIKKRLPSFDNQLWSASAFDENDNLIIEIHREFIAAGASVITTNNYTVVPAILNQAKQLDQFERLTKRAAELAQIARSNNTKIQIAGSLPPLKSTYRPDLALPEAEARPIYHHIASWLQPFVDIYLIESMSSISEAIAGLRAVEPFKTPTWLAFILDDNQPHQLLSGERVADIPLALEGFTIDAVLFNCCQPKSIAPALTALNFDGKTGGYANAFSELPDDWVHGDPRETDQRISPKTYTRFVENWIQAGASIIGGCCEIGPEHIQHLANTFSQHINS